METTANRAAIRFGTSLVFAAGALAVVACGKSPTDPKGVMPNGPSIVSPSGPTLSEPAIVSLRIDGPTDVRGGAYRGTVQYRAIATRSDGSTANVTLRSAWSSSDVSILAPVDILGQLKGKAGGDATVTATIESVSGQITVHVTPTYRISGTVRAADTGGVLRSSVLPVWPDPTIEEDWGAATDADGHYLIDWVTGPITLIASTPGFEPESLSFVAAEDRVIDFALRPRSSPADVTGRWKLTITASDTCRQMLPLAALQREFYADIKQESAQLTIAVTSASLVASSPSIGTMFGTRLETSGSFFRDRLDSSDLDIRGDINAELTGGEIRGTANGFIRFSGAPAGMCLASDHSILLRRN